MANLIVDKANCTFWWDMHLKEGNRVKIMPGYSKFQNNAEANCKRACLMAKIEMLYKNNWLFKSERIEIYKKMGALPNKQNDKLILILFPDDYKIPEELITNYPGEVKTFLEKFYGLIRDNKTVQYLRPLPKKKLESKDSLLDLSKLHFKKLNDLSNYTFKLLNGGHSPGEVENFYRKALNQYFPNV